MDFNFESMSSLFLHLIRQPLPKIVRLKRKAFPPLFAFIGSISFQQPCKLASKTTLERKKAKQIIESDKSGKFTLLSSFCIFYLAGCIQLAILIIGIKRRPLEAGMSRQNKNRIYAWVGGPLDSMQNPCIARSGMGRVVLDDNCFENKFLPQKLVGNTFDTSTFILTWQ